jgi:anion-transporting  ArsA/GET3 family ATPase
MFLYRFRSNLRVPTETARELEMDTRELLERRLHIVSGKGGVGKSVVAATLAWMAAQEGRRTLIVELETVASVPKIFGRPPGTQYQVTPLAKNLASFHVEGKAGLEEYLHLVLKSQRFVRRIVRSPVYHYFVNVAPGLKELMAVGKLWDLEQKRLPETNRPLYDLIVVDTPATGHVLSYLQMPMTAADTAKGFVKREAQKVADLLQDPMRTAFHIVTTLAEMPVNEALELHESARSTLGLPIGSLFINQVVPPFFDRSDYEDYRHWQEDVQEELQRDSRVQNGWADKERTLIACAESWKKVRESQETYLERVKRTFEGKTILLPFVAAPEASLDLIQTLARSISEPDESMKGGWCAGFES